MFESRFLIFNIEQGINTMTTKTTNNIVAARTSLYHPDKHSRTIMLKTSLQSVGDSENSKQLPSSKMAGKYLQPLVYFQKGAEKNLAKFSQCIIDYFGKSGDLKTMVSVELVKNEFIVTDTKSASAQYIKIVHPSFCPIHNINPEQLSEVPEDILNRGINIGVSVLLESADGQILLSRRAAHLRTFPGIWVPPG